MSIIKESLEQLGIIDSKPEAKSKQSIEEATLCEKRKIKAFKHGVIMSKKYKK